MGRFRMVQEILQRPYLWQNDEKYNFAELIQPAVEFSHSHYLGFDAESGKIPAI